jgi:hypothetical protein
MSSLPTMTRRPTMRPADLAWFGLRVPPFSKEIADDDLWLPGSKAELVDELAAAIEARATILLTGEPGVGKTRPARASTKTSGRQLPPDLLSQCDARSS